MAEQKKIVVFAGDGVGKEITREALRIIDWLNDEGLTNIEIVEEDIGGVCLEKYNRPIDPEISNVIASSNAVLIGPIGDPKWDNHEDERLRPINAFFMLYGSFKLYARLTRFKKFAFVKDAFPTSDINLSLLTYTYSAFGYEDDSKIEATEDEKLQIAYDKNAFSSQDIYYLAKYTINLAKSLGEKIYNFYPSVFVNGTNLWVSMFKWTAKEFGIEKENMDFLPTPIAPELFLSNKIEKIPHISVMPDYAYDMVSNMLCTALGHRLNVCEVSLCRSESVENIGFCLSRIEPQNEIAGKDIANPIPMMLALGNMFRYSLDLGNYADKIEQAIENVMGKNLRTQDMLFDGAKVLSTVQMGDEILKEFASLVKAG